MKKEKEDKTKVRVWASIPRPMKDLLAQRARDERNRESEIISKAVTMCLTKDVTDESLLIAKMSEIIRVVENMNTKLDTAIPPPYNARITGMLPPWVASPEITLRKPPRVIFPQGALQGSRRLCGEKAALPGRIRPGVPVH